MTCILSAYHGQKFVFFFVGGRNGGTDWKVISSRKKSNLPAPISQIKSIILDSERSDKCIHITNDFFVTEKLLQFSTLLVPYSGSFW